jgi:hypothetical protein
MSHFSLPAFLPPKHYQIPVFNDCLWRFREHTRWLAIFDLDEYMTPNLLHGHRNMLDALAEYEEGYNHYSAKMVYWSKLDVDAFFADKGHVVLDHVLLRQEDKEKNWAHGMKSISKTKNLIAAGIHTPAAAYNNRLKEVYPSANTSIEVNHFKWSAVVGSKFSSYQAFKRTTYLRDCYAGCVRALAKRFAQAGAEDFECVAKKQQSGCRAAL